MLPVLLAQVRAATPRLLASVLAIVLAVGFVVATLVLGETARSTLRTAAGAQYVGTDAVVTTTDGSPAPAALVRDLPSVRAVAPEHDAVVQAVVPGSGTGARYLRLGAVAPDPVLRWQRLAAGVLPEAAGQVAVSERVGARVGDVLSVMTYAADSTRTTARAEVVGVVDLGGDPAAGLTGRVWASAGQVRQWAAAEPTELRVAGDERLLPELTAALAGRPVQVQTGQERAEAAAAELTGDQVELTSALLLFAAVAVLVAGLVIANTFAVLLAQRTRELALLRCVGATARQVRRSLLGEALLTGLAGSSLGVLAGVGLAAAVSALVGADSPVPLAGTAVPSYAVLVGLAVGTLVTLLAALVPARAATRVAPLTALRPTDPAPLRSRPGVLRLAAGLGLLVLGVAVLALAVPTQDALLAVGGGALSFLGVVLLAQRFVPPVVAVAGRLLARVGGLPAELAAAGASRTPRRTAATATALLVGVTLTTAMVVGAASTRSTAAAGLADQYPTDVVVEDDGGPLPAALLGRLTAVEGVAAGTGLTAAELTGPDGEPVVVQGVDSAAARRVLRSSAVLPDDGQVVLPPYALESWGVREGAQVTLRRGQERLTLTALGGSGDVSGVPLVGAAQLARVAPAAPVAEVWLRLSGASGEVDTAVVDRLTDAAAAVAPVAEVTGLVSARAELDDVLDALLLVVLGLLGVAVVIALLGVGNTLTLSVLERRQENALLRALGLTRRQLRAVLAWEAGLVAGVAAVLGVALGTAYGLAGVSAVLGGQVALVLAVPWLQVAAVAGVATLAGLLASVLPARRAARSSPVEAMAQ